MKRAEFGVLGFLFALFCFKHLALLSARERAGFYRPCYWMSISREFQERGTCVSCEWAPCTAASRCSVLSVLLGCRGAGNPQGASHGKMMWQVGPWRVSVTHLSPQTVHHPDFCYALQSRAHLACLSSLQRRKDV